MRIELRPTRCVLRIAYPATKVMAYAQQKGSVAVQRFVSRNQKHLKQLLKEAKAWADAPEVAAAERKTDWQLIQSLALDPCSCTSDGPCQWEAAVRPFFVRNAASIDEEWLAACLAKVICDGPGKNARVPLLVGVTNAGKSTVLESIDAVFGPENVFHTPDLRATMPLANLATTQKRFIFFDDYQPITFASTPRLAPCVPAISFMKLFAGQHLEIQVPLNDNAGNIDMSWKRGAAITAKMKGLWDRQGCVTAEDIRHMQSRVQQFVATVPVADAVMRDTPCCRTSFSKWLVTRSATFATRQVQPAVAGLQSALRPLPLQDEPRLVEGLAELARQARLPMPPVISLNDDLIALGAIHVSELEPEEWSQLPSWGLLRPLEQRRCSQALSQGAV